MATRDLYEILGVAPGASHEEIRQAYRRLAREAHPDIRRDDPQATERFKEINEAYTILSDPAKRTQYDRFGQVGDYGPFAGDASPFGDLFDMFLGGRGARTVDRSAPERGADLRYDLEITLEEVAIGVEKRIALNRLETCPSCFGTGAEAGSTPQRCGTCDGRGEVRVSQRTVFGQVTQIRTCPQCRGAGTYIARPCTNCRGLGQTEARREVTVSIPAGVEDGTHLRLSGEGEAGVRGGGRGDLYVVIRVAEHARFTRRGRDLMSQTAISMVQAALGADIEVPTLEAVTTLAVPPGTQPGSTLTVRGAGLPDLRGGRGHLHVTVSVTIPKHMSAAQRTLLEEFAREAGEKPPSKKRGSAFKKVRKLLQ